MSNSSLGSEWQSLSFDSSDEDYLEPWENLLMRLTNNHIDALHAIFLSIKDGLNKEEFLNAVEDIFGNKKFSIQAVSLFDSIDINKIGKISWEQFLDYFLNNFSAKKTPGPNLKVCKFLRVPHIKKETVMKILLMETSVMFCYIVISKFGYVCLYDTNMQFLTSYSLVFNTDVQNDKYSKRNKRTWVTDALFLPDVLVLAVVSSARTLIFYDVSGLIHKPMWLIMGITNAVQCLSYAPKQKNPILFLGDDKGAVTSLTFLQTKIGLLRKKHNDKLSTYYWCELSSETEFVLIEKIEVKHSDLITSIRYNSDNDILITSSKDPDMAIAVTYLGRRENPYIFKNPRGVNSFDFNQNMKIFVTCNTDIVIKIWNLYVTEQPIVILKGHRKEILDVKILPVLKTLLSYSKEGVLKMWNLTEYTCVHTLRLEFPSFIILGKKIEWGVNSIYFSPSKRNVNHTKNGTEDNHFCQTHCVTFQLLITCCNYIAILNLTLNKIKEEFVDKTVLPPPPLQNSIMVPISWKSSDAMCDSQKLNIDLGPALTDANIIFKDTNLDYIATKQISMDKKFNINYQAALLKHKKEMIQKNVSLCAPYLALDVSEIEEIKLPPVLPLPNDRKTRKLAERTWNLLSEDSSRSYSLLQYSERSTRSKSSRSSVTDLS